MLVESVEKKQKSTVLLFRRVCSVVSRGLCVERRAKISVNKNDLNTDFPQHLHTHTHTHITPKRESKVMAGEKDYLEEWKQGMTLWERVRERENLHAG